MKLTKGQIEELYVFTRKHYVEHYDLQTELVDHLSNGIEEQWQYNPKLAFDDALQVEFKKFGVFGFMDVVEKRQKAMSNRYRKILYGFVKEWFQLPKLLTTIAIFILFFLVLHLKQASYVLMGLILILGAVNFYHQFKRRKKEKAQKLKKGKVFMLESMINDTGNGVSIMLFGNIFNVLQIMRFNFSELNNYWLALIAIAATLLCLTFYITAYVMPSKAQELLEETYPEYNLI